MLCKHKNSRPVYKVDHVTLWQCGGCRIVFSDKYKSGFDPVKVYNEYYKEEFPSRFRFGLESIVKFFRFQRALGLKRIFPQAKSILDIGSGRGFMLYYLKKHFGFRQTVGTQISKNAYRFSKEELGLEIYKQDLLKINWGKQKYDLITLWHVLEHLKEPERYLDKIASLLHRGGGLIIELPNYDSWTRPLSGPYWLGLDLKYHLAFFNIGSLEQLLDKYNFKITKVKTFSLEYSTFISAESLAGWLTNSNQAFFNWLQRPNLQIKIFVHIPLFLILAPFCFLINLGLYFSRRGEVINIVAIKQ